MSHRWMTGCEAGACVIVKQLPEANVVAIGDTDGSAALYFTTAEWNNFTAAVKAGKFDLTFNDVS